MTSSNRPTIVRDTRALVFAFLTGVAATVGFGAFATDAMPHGFAHHGGAAHSMSKAEIDEHVDKALQHLFIDIEATDAQKARIEPLVRAACTDLMPLHDQLHGAHGDVIALIAADPIDRAAIEALRARHVAQIDQASRRLAQLVADVAETLTPAQRQKFADHVARHHGWQ